LTVSIFKQCKKGLIVLFPCKWYCYDDVLFCSVSNVLFDLHTTINPIQVDIEWKHMFIFVIVCAWVGSVGSQDWILDQKGVHLTESNTSILSWDKISMYLYGQLQRSIHCLYSDQCMWYSPVRRIYIICWNWVFFQHSPLRRQKVLKITCPNTIEPGISWRNIITIWTNILLFHRDTLTAIRFWYLTERQRRLCNAFCMFKPCSSFAVLVHMIYDVNNVNAHCL